MAPMQSDRNQSLADLLKVLICLPRETPVVVSPSFTSWNGLKLENYRHQSSLGDSLWLIDTRDRVSREQLSRWRRHGAAGTGAALILTGSGAPGSRARKLLRRIRHPGMRRLSESMVSEQVNGLCPVITRLAYDDTLEVPTEFEVSADRKSTGAAFLVTREAPFTGRFWKEIHRELGQQDVRINSLHLRARGAAVATLQAGDNRYVARIVPDGPLQSVVARNHTSLLEMHRSLQHHPDLLRLIPEPLMASHLDQTAVFSETCLPGILAWKAIDDRLRMAIREHSIEFLTTLRNATVSRSPGFEALIHDDLVHIENASFVPSSVRREIHDLIVGASRDLGDAELATYTSHGDFGYGNILVDPTSGVITGVIDWDTVRAADFPGVDRINFEIQALRSTMHRSFPDAVNEVWDQEAAHPALSGEGRPGRTSALFAIGVCRYITRAFSYPAIYDYESRGFQRALAWLAGLRNAHRA